MCNILTTIIILIALRLATKSNSSAFATNCYKLLFPLSNEHNVRPANFATNFTTIIAFDRVWLCVHSEFIAG